MKIRLWEPTEDGFEYKNFFGPGWGYGGLYITTGKVLPKQPSFGSDPPRICELPDHVIKAIYVHGSELIEIYTARKEK